MNLHKQSKKYKENAHSLLKKHTKNFKLCMAYDNFCKGEIVEAHTISKKYLRNISSNNHVYMPILSTEGLYKFELRGLNKATCNTKFCSYHDNLLFESFEKDKEFYGNTKQIYDLTFRSLCREYFQKKRFEAFLNESKSFDRTGYTSSLLYKDHVNHLKDELEDHKFLYDQLRITKDTELKFLLIETSKLPLATTGIFFPLLDPKGNLIQEATQGKRQHGFIYNIVTLENKSYIVISTVSPLAISVNNRVHRDFLTPISELYNSNTIAFLFSYFFFNNDNIALNPEWFEGLSKNFKNYLTKLMNYQVGQYSKITINDTSYFFHKLKKIDVTIKNVNLKVN